MTYHRTAQRSAEGCGDLQRRVEHAHRLVCQTLVSLSRDAPPDDSLGATAHDALVALRPRVQGALEALEGIEERRPLTDEELARRHAFTTLLYAARR